MYLEIISPEKTFLTDNPKSVTVPAFEGDMTILTNHMPLITFLRPGIIKVLGNSETEFFVEDVDFFYKNLQYDDLKQWLIKGIWYFDKKYSELIYRPIGIAPVAVSWMRRMMEVVMMKIP